MDSSSRISDLTRPSLPVSTGISSLYGLSSSSSRSSPRSRRDNTILPTFDPNPNSPLRPSSSFFRTPVYFKHRKEGRIPRCQFSRRFLPWLALILVWFFIGFGLHIKWSDDDSPGIRHSSSRVGRNETEISNQIGGESNQILEQANGDGLAEEDMASIENAKQGNAMLENVEHKKGESRDFGRVVGPFDEMERRVLVKRDERGRGCSTQGLFTDFVKKKSFVMVFHELSMTGAPLAMLELASKIVTCGGKVSAVVLNRRGGLYNELLQRGIVVVRDKLASSWKAAARADLVVASSAACNAWIEQYLRYNRKGGERLIWWMMENRREYFERSKLLLGKARALVFLSVTQEQLWRQWAMEDALVLPSMIKVVSLSVSDDLAAAAGLNDEDATVNSFIEAQRKREMLRNLVRKEMGLLPSDYLVISLSSINPGKGQLLMLQAALMVAEEIGDGGRSNLAQSVGASSDDTGVKIQTRERRESKTTRNLRILLGSVGSKSNKPEYLEKIHALLTMHSSVAEMLLWTEATVHVAPLYAAADAYVMNAQGIGETFGRVTVEAMAFGLPVLGTDAGGTKEIVQENITGFLHPAGHTGIPVLAHNLQWLLSHPEIGVEMGRKGRARVQDIYREGPMYEAMASVFLDSVQERGG